MLCYPSRMLVGDESNYTPIEKVCVVLVLAVKKLRHYVSLKSMILNYVLLKLLAEVKFRSRAICFFKKQNNTDHKNI